MTTKLLATTLPAATTYSSLGLGILTGVRDALSDKVSELFADSNFIIATGLAAGLGCAMANPKRTTKQRAVLFALSGIALSLYFLQAKGLPAGGPKIISQVMTGATGAVSNKIYNLAVSYGLILAAGASGIGYAINAYTVNYTVPNTSGINRMVFVDSPWLKIDMTTNKSNQLSPSTYKKSALTLEMILSILSGLCLSISVREVLKVTGIAAQQLAR